MIDCEPSTGKEMQMFQVISRARDEYKVLKTLERIFAEDEE
jgi:hypothetical protein